MNFPPRRFHSYGNLRDNKKPPPGRFTEPSFDSLPYVEHSRAGRNELIGLPLLNCCLIEVMLK